MKNSGNEEALYYESIAFIENNKNCLSTEISMKFVDFWILDHEANSGPEFGVYMCVAVEHKKTNNIVFSLNNVTELLELAKGFQIWQKTLKMIKEKYDLGLPIPCFKLFDLDVLARIA